MTNSNRQWLINGRPVGRPLADDDFKFVETPVVEPNDGEVLVHNLYLAFDPALKGHMENISNYVAPTQIGEVMRGSGIGEVVASKAPGFAIGDKVMGGLRWQTYATVSAKELLKVVDDELLTANLGVLGTTGMTALFGLFKIGKPFVGDTMVVTGAAGATGSVVGQLGKIAGCRVIGVAGGAEKCAWLVEELGFDAAVDYKAGDLQAQVKAAAPEGIDVLWDNVGGRVFNDVLGEIAMHARVVTCGNISRHEPGMTPSGPANYFNLIFKRARMEGFIVSDWVDEFPWARARLARFIREGRLHYKEDIQQGIENAPSTLKRLFEGRNFGKQLLKL